MPALQVEPVIRTEFQVVLRILPVPNDDRDLAVVAELVLDALTRRRGWHWEPWSVSTSTIESVEIEMTVEALAASEVHQKMGLILGVLERGGRFIVQDSAASRSQDPSSSTPDAGPAAALSNGSSLLRCAGLRGYVRGGRRPRVSSRVNAWIDRSSCLMLAASTRSSPTVRLTQALISRWLRPSWRCSSATRRLRSWRS